MVSLCIQLQPHMCFGKSRLATLYESSLFICKQPLISSFASTSAPIQEVQPLSRIIYLLRDGYDITSPENIGGLWLGERLLACCVTIIFDTSACFLRMSIES